MAAVMYTVETPRRRVGFLPGTVAAPRRRPVAVPAKQPIRRHLLAASDRRRRDRDRHRADGNPRGRGARRLPPHHLRAPPAHRHPRGRARATRCGRSRASSTRRPIRGRSSTMLVEARHTHRAHAGRDHHLARPSRRSRGRPGDRKLGSVAVCAVRTAERSTTRSSTRVSPTTGGAVRRRRECLACGRRFTTLERALDVSLTVRKRSGAVEPFDHDKLGAGHRARCERPARRRHGRSARRRAGRRAAGAGCRGHERGGRRRRARAAARLDPIAYLRFSSVYKGFEDLADFEREVGELQRDLAGRDLGGRPAEDDRAQGPRRTVNFAKAL